MRSYKIGFTVCLLAIFWSATSYAVQVGIDLFSLTSSTLTFTDPFSDGPPPPCGPSGCVSQPTFYGVNSTSPLPAESGGFLQLDSSNGILGTNAGGGARINETVTKAGSISQLDQTTAGAISMTGIFTLSTVSGPLNEGYGIRFIDAPAGSPPGSNQQILELNVQWWTGNASNPAGFYIRYLVQDFNLDSIQTIDADLVNIPQGADEICLSLNRSAGSDSFSASYAYATGGTCGNQVSLGSATGFAYQDFVRAQFHAFETVPEPGTWLLTGMGLVGLRLVARRDGREKFGTEAAPALAFHKSDPQSTMEAATVRHRILPRSRTKPIFDHAIPVISINSTASFGPMPSSSCLKKTYA